MPPPPNLLMLPTPLIVQEIKLVNRWLSSCYSSVARDVQPIPWDSKDKEIFAMLDDIYIANKQNPLPICHPTWRRWRNLHTTYTWINIYKQNFGVSKNTKESRQNLITCPPSEFSIQFNSIQWTLPIILFFPMASFPC